MDAKRSRILGVSEVVLNVEDLAAMRRFYEEVLGFRFHSSFPADAEPTLVFLIIGDSATPLGSAGHPPLLALVDAARHLFSRDAFRGLDAERSPLNHLAFEIDLAHWESERDRLAGLGLEVRTMVFPALAARAIFFDDPEGNTLELIAHDASVAGPEPYRSG